MKIMKKIIFSIFAALMFMCPLSAQDARQRNVETIVQDVMAALPAQNAADCYEQMADLAKAAPQSVTYLASKLQPVSAAPVSNNILEYAISGVVRYATDPANAEVKENVKKGLEQAIAAATDKYIRQFLEAQLSLMLPYADTFPAHMQVTYAEENVKSLLKSKEERDQCRGLWLAVETLGAKAEKIILSALKSDSRAVRTTALLAYGQQAGDEFYAQVAKLYRKLSPEAKADIVYWFGEADVKSQLPLVMSELDADGELGANAIEAAGKIGDRKTAEVLVSMLGGENTPAVVSALKHIRTDVSDLVAAAFEGADSKKTSGLLALASAKSNKKASASVIALAKSGDKQALASLANVVNPSEFVEMAQMLDAAEGETEQLGNALKSTLKGISDKDKFSKIVAFAENAQNPENFYQIIASTGTDESVNYLAEKHKAGSAKALDALTKSKNRKAAPIILDAAGDNPEYLKRYVNLVTAGGFDENRACEYLCRALDKTADNGVRNYVIKALGSIPTMRSFNVAASYLDYPELVRSAAGAVRAIAAKRAAALDYYRLNEVLPKAAAYFKSTGGADDGYAADEIKTILETVKPYEKSQLTEEEKSLGYEMLFDGTDLSKWVGDKVGYQAVNGCIEVSASYGDSKNLYTEKEYTDFILRFEFCFLRSGVNNGVGIRTPMGVDAAYHGMCEVQVLDHDAPIYADLKVYQVHGSVYGIVPAKRIVHKPLGEWSTMEIRVVGETVKVFVNGELINDANVRTACQGHNVAPDGGTRNPYTVDKKNHPGLFNEKGHVGFLGHGAGLKYRNVRILDLSKSK